jgi:hypothetical protein
MRRENNENFHIGKKKLVGRDIWNSISPPPLIFRFVQILGGGIIIAPPAIDHMVIVFINGVMFIPFCGTAGYKHRNNEDNKNLFHCHFSFQFRTH